MNDRQEGTLGLSINTLMREVLIEQGIPFAQANAIVNRFATAFDALTGTQWVEINGTTEWKLSFDGRKPAPLSEDMRKRDGIPSECPCGKPHPKGKRGRSGILSHMDDDDE